MQQTTSVDVGELQRQSQTFHDGDLAERSSSFASTQPFNQFFSQTQNANHQPKDQKKP